MSLKSTRKILCFLFVSLLVAGNILFFGSALVKNTLCSADFLKRTFLTQDLKEQCEKNFESRMNALELDSLIPVRVFETVSKVDDETSEDAIDRLFGEHDTSLYTADRVETFEELCKEYLDGNGIKYNEEQVQNTAVRAAQIYADSYGINNTQSIAVFIDKVDTSYARYASIGLLLIVISFIMIFSLFSKKRDAVETILSGYTATGITFVLTAVVSLIAKFGQSPNIYPSFYADAVAGSVRIVFLILLLTGIVITAVAYFTSVQVEKNRSELTGK